jgi:hypothetical protein
MRQACQWFSVRGMLVGMACGAGVGVLLYYAVAGGPKDAVGAANESREVAACAGIVAVLGGIAGGVLRATGWTMFAGGVIGAVVVGIGGVVATHHLKGLVYSFVGVPFGALFVFLYGVGHKMAKPAVRACVPPVSADAWGGELDR